MSRPLRAIAAGLSLLMCLEPTPAEARRLGGSITRAAVGSSVRAIVRGSGHGDSDEAAASKSVDVDAHAARAKAKLDEEAGANGPPVEPASAAKPGETKMICLAGCN